MGSPAAPRALSEDLAIFSAWGAPNGKDDGAFARDSGGDRAGGDDAGRGDDGAASED